MYTKRSIQVRCTPEELEKWEKAAQEAGVSTAAWARAKLNMTLSDILEAAGKLEMRTVSDETGEAGK